MAATTEEIDAEVTEEINESELTTKKGNKHG